jgi:cell surface protein SprA
LRFKYSYIFRAVVATIVFSSLYTEARAGYEQNSPDTLKYPLTDRRADPYTNRNRNTFDFSDTAYLKRNIEYDPVTKQYFIIEKIGNQYYRTPMTFSMREFMELKARQDEREYFRQRADLLTKLNKRNVRPRFNFSKDWVNRITGNGKTEIIPNGYVDIAAGYQGQKIDNPTLPERARRNGGFDFNMNAQLQVDAKIGDKIRLPINYNTLANFDFENQLKLDYQGRDDEILKLFQAGTINFSSKGSLIPGAQSLFGVKTQLQFGKVYVTTVLANQRSQRQSLGLQGSSATQSFNLRSDEYEENRHFLMAQYFRNRYNRAMQQLPIVRSNVQIMRVEVWVTNRTGATTDTRDIVALMDLGESVPFNPNIGGSPDSLPQNNSNDLYRLLTANPNLRNSTQVQSGLLALGRGLLPVQDFEKTFGRKLQPSDYYFNPQIGFLSLNQPLQADEVLGIAYQYTFNGRVYQVGEFSQDIPPDSSGNSQNVLFLKLLKATSQRPSLPIWDLMMKNVYSVGYGQLQREDFDLDVFYEEPSFGTKMYLPLDSTLPAFRGQPLIRLLNLDRLNNQNDPQPDGVFDYVEGFTVISSQSRIIFPVLEPFGRDLEYAVPTGTRERMLYYPLYDTIKAIAQNFANLNRFKLIGRSRSASNSDYQLGFNIPRGSVTVTAGGQVLQEGNDYDINYDLGTLKITNPAIINAGLPVQVQYENNASFGLQQKNFLGFRVDYLANKHLSLGATMVKLGERPFFTKQSYGEDPIKNTMYGIDADYRNDIPRLSKWLDKLPFYSTRTTSSITAYGEAAMLKPGHSKLIGKGGEGVIYVDDFEGTRSSIDLRFPLISWTLASTPQNAKDRNGQDLFPEALLMDNIASGYNRARLAWYNIEPQLQEKRNSNNPLRNNLAELSKPETRQVYMKEIFPQRTLDYGQALVNTFDLAFYPREKGPYNFQTALGPNGELVQPRRAWGGIMRNIDQTDFETSNIEFIEFWLQDPFISRPGSSGGELYFNLGNISEDVLRDGKRLYENGLSTPNIATLEDETSWGFVPRNPIQVTNAFSNDPADRPFQDVGFDGMTDNEEKTKFGAYLSSLASIYGTSHPVYQRALADPSSDNFLGYRDASFNETNGILERYKRFNNPHGNSPVATSGQDFTNAFTLYPDQEELNRDNTLNEVEEYFQYRVELTPNMDPQTHPYITDRRTVNVDLADNTTRTENWYLFRIPIKEYEAKVGNIPDFKSIRFIRMFLTGFEETTVLRFGKLELVRNQWRKFDYEIDTTGIYRQLPTNDFVSTDVLAVNIEENDQRQPVNYVQPPGIERQQQLSNNNVQLLQNEQSLSLRVCDLPRDKTRGVFKTMNLDLRQYGRLSMFVHAESVTRNVVQSDDLNAVIRIGNDFVSNYYEIKIPLKITDHTNSRDSLVIWPELNNLDFDLQILTALKSERNRLGPNPSVYYSKDLADGRQISILGNPNLGEVRGMLLGVENVRREVACAEIWFNELRLSKLDEEGGYAALARVDLRLADLGNISVAGSVRSIGFGTLEQRVNERSREDFKQFDVSTNIDAGRLLPKKAGIQIPVFASVSKTSSNPEYDPYDLDLKLKDKLRDAPKEKQDSIRNDAVDLFTIKTLTFTSVKKNKTNGKPVQPWDISNIDLNYSVTHQERSNPIIESEDVKRTRGAVSYTYNPQQKFIKPLQKVIKSRSPWYAMIRDFNFNYKPQVSIRADVFRQFGSMRSRNVGAPFKLPETYDKFFYFDRYYTVRWNLTESLVFDFNAVNNGRVDEPAGRIDTKQKKDSVKTNLFRGGRTTRYHHDASLGYTLPTTKLPFLDWTTFNVTYVAKYDWIAASLLARELGNTLLNGQTRTANGALNFEQLYNKSRFLRALNNDVPVPKPVKTDAKDTSAVKKRKDPNSLPYISPVPRFFGRMLTSLKQVNIQYNEDLSTLLPGYMDSTQYLGMNFRSHRPGWGFISGLQPDTSDINEFAAKGLLSRDSLFNALIQQRYNQRISLTAMLSPIRDLQIDLTMERTYDKNYSELNKDTTGRSGITRLNPYATGSFSMSYISYQTLFERFDPNEVSPTFKRFEDNRRLLSERLGVKNIYADPNQRTQDGYIVGYGRYAQDVLIPAFLAAYTDKDPNSIQLLKNSNPKLRSNPFSRLMPKPNWNVTYNGLSRMKAFEKLFTNFTIRHGYNSQLSMNSFTTALLFQDRFHVGFPEFLDTTTGNFVPYFLVPNVTITESFSPLAGFDITFSNGITTNFEYRKSRTLSLSLVDYQLAENRSTEYTFGFNWRKRGVPFLQNIKIGKNGKKLDNDVTFRIDYSMRDDATANSKLDQNAAFGTSGQKVTRLAPSIDYVVNQRVKLMFYYEQNKVIPKIATSAPVTNTRAGLQVRIALTQ